MRTRVLLIAAVALLLNHGSAFAAGSQLPPTLLPMPASIDLVDGEFTVDESFDVAVAGAGATDRLRRGVQRALRRLSDRSGTFFYPSTFLNLEPRSGAKMSVFSQRAGDLSLGEDESYELSITENAIRLKAITDIGALRGLETLIQLLDTGSASPTFPVVNISDRPRFPWRGLMMDVSRHFMPVEVLKRNLDGMAAVKLNVLHWHLSEDQGFRVESRSFPRLHQLGSDGLYYTQTQIREVIEYAADRGIRVVPEFDVPGHATSWLVGYPELGSAPGPYAIERSWGIFDPSMNPTREDTYIFLDAFFTEMAELFPDQYMHIGGDENTGKHWLANPEIVAFMDERGLEKPLQLQRYFNQRLLEILTRNGKRMIGWDEILQPELPTNVVIHSWRGRESLYEAARKGYAGILSNGYYIDLIQSTEFHYLNDPLPADAPITQAEREKILGGEATMWAEYVTHETVDSRIWPRTAAIAERLWSPATVNDVQDMYRRLDRISLVLEEHGLQHEKNRPMMLRRLCNCRDIEPLEIFLGALEPVKIYRRGQLKDYTQFSPLTRIVDVAWPDAAPARRFRDSVTRFISTQHSETSVSAEARSHLELWADNHASLDGLLASSALTEMQPMAERMRDTTSIGLEVLDLLNEGTPADEDWIQDRLLRLQDARQPCGQTELMIVDPVQNLVCFAAANFGLSPKLCVEEPQPDQLQPAH